MLLKKLAIFLIAFVIVAAFAMIQGCSESDKGVESVVMKDDTDSGTLNENEVPEFLTGEEARAFLEENCYVPDDAEQVKEDSLPMITSYPSYSFCLNVPWMSQLPSGTDWNRTNNCGQACCVMLGGYFNHGSVAPWVIDAENRWLGYPTPYGNTTGQSTLRNLLWGFHRLRSQYHVGSEPDDVVMEGTRRHSVIVGVRTRMSQSGGRAHWMLFVGYSGNYMYFHDPGRSSVSDGRFVRYTINEFRRSWANQGKKYIPVWK